MRAVITFLPAKTSALITLRWHSWIARPPPKGQVAGSNPARSAKIFYFTFSAVFTLSGSPNRDQELHDNMEQPARVLAQSGRF
jgi:hypothetical protein